MAEEWEDLLNMNAEDAVKPPPRPNGTYRCLVKKKGLSVSKEKKTKGADFEFSVWDAQSDVDPGQWKAYLEHKAIKGNPGVESKTFYLTPKAVHRLREFCEACGARPDGTLKKMMDDADGHSVLVVIKQRLLDDGETVVGDIHSFAKDPAAA